MPPPSVVAVLWEITAPLIMASFAEEASATPPPFSAVFAFAAKLAAALGKSRQEIAAAYAAMFIEL